MELLVGNTEDALESGNVYTKQQRIAELENLYEICKERVREGSLRSETIIPRNRMR
jgi:hypothetical protein